MKRTDVVTPSINTHQPFVLILFLFVSFGQVYTLRNATTVPDKKVYEELSANLNPDQKLVMWGYRVDFHFELDVESPSRFYYHHPFLMCDYVTETMVDDFIRDIDSAKPMIVDTKGMGNAYVLDLDERDELEFCPELTPFFDYIKTKYTAAGVLSNGFTLFKPR